MINVIWWGGYMGSWDHGLLQSIFDKHPETFHQHNSKELIYPESAIVIVIGMAEVAPLRAYLDKLKSGIVILTSEEDAFFDWKAAIPPHLEIWTQYYSQSKEGIKTRLLLGAPNRIKDYKINSHLPKKYLWSFVGQNQNPSRQKCVEVLRGLPDGFLHVAGAFGGQENGIEYQEYLDIMCQSKFVICPAGSMCVDSFRFYEAIECGAVPITEPRAPRDNKSFDYWAECLPDNSGALPDNSVLALSDWSLLKSCMDSFEFGYDALLTIQMLWWEQYKQDLEQKLLNYANSIL